MCVKHGSRIARPDDFNMDQRFGRRAARADRRAPLVDLHDFVRAKVPLERRAWRNGHLQRLMGEDGAEVAAGAEHPAAGVNRLPTSMSCCAMSGKLCGFMKGLPEPSPRREKPSLY